MRRAQGSVPKSYAVTQIRDTSLCAEKCKGEALTHRFKIGAKASIFKRAEPQRRSPYLKLQNSADLGAYPKIQWH
jgi:hypothetical protein